MKIEASAVCTLLHSLSAIESEGAHWNRRDYFLKMSSIVEAEKKKVCLLTSEEEVDIIAPDTSRGLELALFPTRKRIKHVVMRSLLKYQRLLDTKKPNLAVDKRQKALAGASRKLTAWSRQVALETARWDALRAYDATDYPIETVGEEPTEVDIYMPPFPPLYSKKKSCPPTVMLGCTREEDGSRHSQQEEQYQQTTTRQPRRMSRRVTHDEEDEGASAEGGGILPGRELPKRRKVDDGW